MTVIDILDMLNNNITPPETIMFGEDDLYYDRNRRSYYDISGDRDIMDIIAENYWSLEQLYDDDIEVKNEDEDEAKREYYINVKKEIIKYGISCEDSDEKEIVIDILEILTREYFNSR